MSNSTAATRLKFARFYESVKQFVIDAQLSKPEDVVGSDIQTIEKIEIELGIKLPNFLFSFFQYFGKKVKVKHTDELLNLTILDFKEANLEAEHDNILEILKNENGLKGYDRYENIHNVSDIMDINNVLIINSNSLWHSFGFINSKEDNPIIYYIYQREYFGSENMIFTNYIRDVLFDVVKYRFKNYTNVYDATNPGHHIFIDNQESVQEINIDKIVWSEYYLNFGPDKKYYLYNDLGFRNLRREFYLLASKKEAETDTILTIDEFELAFIEFLKERNFGTSE